MDENKQYECFPYGKYANVPLAQVPTDYIAFCLNELSDSSILKEIAEQELIRRKSKWLN